MGEVFQSLQRGLCLLVPGRVRNQENVGKRPAVLDPGEGQTLASMVPGGGGSARES